MKLSAFRGFLFGCLAMLAAAFTMSMPATASAEPIVQTFELRIPDVADLAVVTPSAVVAAEDAALIKPGARPSIGAGLLHPVYDLSYRTNGASLAAYHLRC